MLAFRLIAERLAFGIPVYAKGSVINNYHTPFFSWPQLWLIVLRKLQVVEYLLPQQQDRL